MESKLERKWWFFIPVLLISIFLTQLIFDMAGVQSPDGLAGKVLHFFCVLGFWRCLSFLGWMGVVLVAPKAKVLG